MKSSKITHVSGTAIPLLLDDIDTDMIIPARFLKEITFSNMGKYVFFDARFDSAGNQKQHPFNDPRFKGASILISGSNFGCGSSREHAAQALYRYGIRAILAESFSQIFSSNCLSIGLPTLKLSRSALSELILMVEKNPQTKIEIFLSRMQITAGDNKFGFEIKREQLYALLNGSWDSLFLLRDSQEEVKKLVQALPYTRLISSKNSGL